MLEKAQRGRNLDAHLRRLEDAGFIERAVRRNPLIRQIETRSRATVKRRKAFDSYLLSTKRRLAAARKVRG